MKYLFLPALVVLVVSCGGTADNNSNANPNDLTVSADSVESGIIEYDLNEDRLSAVDYNNELSLMQQSVYDQINVLFTSEPEQVNLNHENALFEIGLKTNDLKAIEAPENGAAFKKGLVDLFEFYQTELKGGFTTVIPILEKPTEERTQTEAYALVDYDEQFAITEEKYFVAIAAAQEEFAKVSNFKMQ